MIEVLSQRWGSVDESTAHGAMEAVPITTGGNACRRDGISGDRRPCRLSLIIAIGPPSFQSNNFPSMETMVLDRLAIGGQAIPVISLRCRT